MSERGGSLMRDADDEDVRTVILPPLQLNPTQFNSTRPQQQQYATFFFLFFYCYCYCFFLIVLCLLFLRTCAHCSMMLSVLHSQLLFSEPSSPTRSGPVFVFLVVVHGPYFFFCLFLPTFTPFGFFFSLFSLLWVSL